MLNIALIGLGYWGKKYFKLLSEMEGVNFIACADVDQNKNNLDFSDQSKISFFTDYKEMLQRFDLDGVVVATPASTHFSIAKYVLESGVDLLIEKPMTTSSEDARELIKIAIEKKKVIMVGHTFLFDENFRSFMELYSKDFQSFNLIKSTRLHFGLEREDVSCVWDLLSHDLSILNELVKNRPLSVKAFPLATCLKTKRIGKAAVYLNFEGDLRVEIELGWLSHHKVRKLELQTNDQVIQCDYFPKFEVKRNSCSEFIENKNKMEPLEYQLTYFFDSIKNRHCARSSGADAINIVSLVELADRSIQNNGTEYMLI